MSLEASTKVLSFILSGLCFHFLFVGAGFAETVRFLCFMSLKIKGSITMQIQLKYLAEEMQAISKGLEKVVQELTASENDGIVSDNFCKVLCAI